MHDESSSSKAEVMLQRRFLAWQRQEKVAAIMKVWFRSLMFHCPIVGIAVGGFYYGADSGFKLALSVNSQCDEMLLHQLSTLRTDRNTTF